MNADCGCSMPPLKRGAMVARPWRGFLAILLYLVVGFAGLPVFAGGAAGLGVLAKPSIGYLLAFPIGAAVTGAVARPSLSPTSN